MRLFSVGLLCALLPLRGTGVEPSVRVDSGHVASVVQLESLDEPPAGELLEADGESLVLAANSGVSHIKVPTASGVSSSAASLAADFQRGVLQSLAAKRAEDARRLPVRAALRRALRAHLPGADLGVATPEDGHCVLHALRSGGLANPASAPCDLSVMELRHIALSSATPEQLSVVAAGTTDRRYLAICVWS